MLVEKDLELDFSRLVDDALDLGLVMVGHPPLWHERADGWTCWQPVALPLGGYPRTAFVLDSGISSICRRGPARCCPA